MSSRPSIPGLVGRWSFNEGSGTVAGDASGNGLTGTFAGSPQWSNAAPPSGGSSLIFDGQSHVRIGDPPALRMTNTMSLEAWIYPTWDQRCMIVNKENEYQVARFPDGSIQYAFKNTSPCWAWVNTGITAPLNTWSHIGLTYDNGVVTAYLNGVQVGAPYPGSGPITYGGREFWIGQRGNGGEAFYGAIDEVRVWNTVHAPSVEAPTGERQTFVTRNTYNSLGLLLSTQDDDEGRTEYVYARDGRIRFSQSALQRPAGRYSYSNYDELGRTVESGEYTLGQYATHVFENHLTTTPVGNSVLQPNILESRERNGGLFPGWCGQRNQTWYDLPWDGTPGSEGNDAQLNGRKQEFVLGAVAKTRNDQVTTWYSYDHLGRVVWVVQDVIGVGVKTLDYTYDFSGNVLEVAYQTGQPDAFRHYYTYDDAQRLTAVHTSPDGAERTLQAKYFYYLHGPLKRVELADRLQGLDYTYTLQGTLKSINHVNERLDPGADSPAANGTPKDLFGLTLDYFSGDYRSRNLNVMTPTGLSSAANPFRYDGTIRGAAWRTAASADRRQVVYAYDEKSQLKESTYGKLGISGSFYYFNADASNAFQEGGLSYDANGNIQALRRTNNLGAVTDNFAYKYAANTNKLAEVHSGSLTGPTVLDYDYDAVGQMTRQRDEQGQRYFMYDASGKTTGVYLDAAHQQPVVEFAYDNRGFRVRKKSYGTGTSAGEVRTTYYVCDIAGNVMSTYEQGPQTGNAIQRTEVPLYGSSRVGTLTRLDDASEDYRYEITDNLGNARVVFHKPTTETNTETMELSGVSNRAAFQNNNLYRVALSGAPSGSYVARFSNNQAPGQEMKRALTVEKGDTITFTVKGLLPSPVVASLKTRPQPYLLLGATAIANGLPASEKGDQPAGTTQLGGNWLARVAAGLEAV